MMGINIFFYISIIHSEFSVNLFILLPSYFLFIGSLAFISSWGSQMYPRQMLNVTELQNGISLVQKNRSLES